MTENQDAPSSIRVFSEAESDAPGNESEPDNTPGERVDVDWNQEKKTGSR